MGGCGCKLMVSKAGILFAVLGYYVDWWVSHIIAVAFIFYCCWMLASLALAVLLLVRGIRRGEMSDV